jgi:excisionase family DNA binding protein
MNAPLPEPAAALPSADELELAAEAGRFIAAKGSEAPLSVVTEDGEKILLPDSAKRLLAHLLTEMGRGNAVRLVALHAELTTQEAADILNVSRPHLIKLLDEEKIPFHRVGSHRRIRFNDLAEYRRRFEEHRQQAMNELAAQAQELGMGY